MKYEMNVSSQHKALADKSVLKTTQQSTDLHHLFTGIKVTPEQQHDLLNFMCIGQEEFENRVEYFILKAPSARLCRRRKQLLTFSERKSRAKKVSEVEKERKLQLECWKKRVAYASKMGLPMSNTYEQCIELPRAIATAKGNLIKGTKANATKVYAKRYKQALEQIIRTSYPPGWVPDVVIVEGMFLINISPWGGHSTMSDYAAFWKNQHIDKHFKCGAKEVHVIFDNPGSLPCTPKQFEHIHRDKQSSNTGHTCTASTRIPKRWREDVLQCRKCKRNLVVFLTEYFLTSMLSLSPTQTFVTAGGFEGDDKHRAYCVQADGVPQVCPRLACNAEETDTRLWLHVKTFHRTKKACTVSRH